MTTQTPQQHFEQSVAAAIAVFPGNRFTQLIDEERIVVADYHRLLLMIFHQTFRAPQSFALAGAMMPERHLAARNYLITHAAEEHTHWQWALNDLEQTGYVGADPRLSTPPPACAAYIGFNYYVSLQHPIARLAIASVLEGLGATYSKPYAMKVAKQLQLKPEQMVFFLGHSDTDVVHTQDIRDVIAESALTVDEWQWMSCAATTAGKLYADMYNEAAG